MNWLARVGDYRQRWQRVPLALRMAAVLVINLAGPVAGIATGMAMVALLLWATGCTKHQPPTRPEPVSVYVCNLHSTTWGPTATGPSAPRCWVDICHQLAAPTTNTGELWWVAASDGRWWVCDNRQGEVCEGETQRAVNHCKRTLEAP